MMRLCVAVPLLAALVLVSIVSVEADIPVHCLHTHVRGTWTFHRSAANGDRHSAANCNKAGNYLGGGDFGLGEPGFTPADAIQVHLSSPNIASAKIGGKDVKGTWTMMYDEGFEVSLGEQKYFAFSKYTGTHKHTVSHCDKTFPGWYHSDPEKKTWGCYYGVKHTKVRPQKFRRFGEGKSLGFKRNSDGDIVCPHCNSRGHTARHAMPTAQQDAGKGPKGPAAEQAEQAFKEAESEMPAMVQQKKPKAASREVHQIDNDPTALTPQDKAAEDEYVKQHQQAEQAFKEAESEVPPVRDALVQVDANTESESSAEVVVDADRDYYADQKDLVNAVNRGHRSGKHTWHAAHYSPRAIRKMGTIRQSYKGGISDLGEVAQWRKKVAANVNVKDVPKAFDWGRMGADYTPPVRNQKCGSCYAFATRDMMEARLAILTRKNRKAPRKMSVQSVLSCNRYSQGCKGGFPFTVAKFFQDYGATSDKVQPSNAAWHGPGSKMVANPDKVQCKKSSKPVARAWDYKYVGGFYGATNEKAMLRDIYDHGPLAVCFQVGMGFGNYKGGVFRQEAALPRQHHWDRVNHAVLITGWGQTKDGHKYWKVKNSWGNRWGEKGYFRIERGTNQLNIETDAVAVYPTIGPSLHTKKKMSLKASLGKEVKEEVERLQNSLASSQDDDDADEEDDGVNDSAWRDEP